MLDIPSYIYQCPNCSHQELLLNGHRTEFRTCQWCGTYGSKRLTIFEYYYGEYKAMTGRVIHHLVLKSR